MNDSAIKNFCTWARRELVAGVGARMGLFGVAEGAEPAGSDSVGGRALSPGEREQRDALLRMGRDQGFDRLRDRAAYTWFNRIAAVRYMEVNGFLPSRVRMFTRPAAGGGWELGSQAVDEALDIEIEGADPATVVGLKQAGDDGELFRYLFLAQCDELQDCLPDVFQRVDGCMALLLPANLMDPEGVVGRMVADIPEEDWLDSDPDVGSDGNPDEGPDGERGKILGWMYQYYNAEVKDAFFKSKAKETPETIGPATQLFTPDWIVRYMVENSLGRLWMLNNPDSPLRDRMAYYIEPDAEHEDFIRIDGPEDITFLDPACGSGHILLAAFDLLFEMYKERGYTDREIPGLILTKNLFGFEIDPRAAQIAGLSLAMRARRHDRRFLRRGVSASIGVLKPVAFDGGELPEGCALAKKKDLLGALEHLDEIGSLLAPGDSDLAAIREAISMVEGAAAGLFGDSTVRKLRDALATCESLSRRFACVVANPPYMGSSSFGPFLSKWVKKSYPDVKSDLFSSFIFRIMGFADDRAECGIMCPFVWMFIGSYEKLRTEMVDSRTLTSLIQLEYSGFAGATVPICTFTFHNSHIDGYRGGYVRLSDFVGSAKQAPKALEAIGNPDCGWFYRRDADTFKQIPGAPIAYWASDSLLDAFGRARELKDFGKPRQGLATGENARFVREWWEVDSSSSDYSCKSVEDSVKSGRKWFPYNKGGDYRKWYGNNDWIINWENDGRAVRDFPGSVIRNPECYFKPSITWSKISSGSIAFRYKPAGHVFDVAGTSVFADEESLQYLQGACNSAVIMSVAGMLSPTLNFEVGQIATYPIIENNDDRSSVDGLVDQCRDISKGDWDSFETSWDFKRNSLV